MIALLGLVSLARADIQKRACGTQPTKLTAQQIQDTLDIHNQIRGKEQGSNILKLVWSDEIASVAQTLADTCSGKHGMQSDCSGQGIGQNNFIAGGGAAFPVVDMKSAVTDWASERQYWNFGTNTCQAPTGKYCGHYTQLAWANTQKVGCGYAQCPQIINGATTYKNALFIVCNYAKQGNYDNQPVFLPGTPCSSCDTEGTGAGYKCTNNLCDRCTPSTDSTCKCSLSQVSCQNGGAWSTATCQCNCAPGFYGAKCESPCNCKDASPYCDQWKDLCPQADYKDFLMTNCMTTCNFPCNLPASCNAAGK